MDETSRREFLRMAAAAGLAASVGTESEASSPRGEYGRNAVPLPTVRVGLVGIGAMGNSHLKQLTKIPEVDIRAVCDISAYKAGYAKWYLETHGRPSPETYSNGDTDFENFCAREDLDLVLNATPWNWHVPICLAAMNHGKHAATEVPAAQSVEDCWKLVDKADLPRPYSRINLVQGTKGLFSGYSDRLYLDGRSPEHQWEDAAAYYEAYDHPLYTATREAAADAGHGGSDYVEDYRLIRCLVAGESPDQDVYDAAAWSCIVELSCRSVASKGAPVVFPDFTRGAWKTRPPLGIVSG